MRYEVRVQGELGPGWEDWFGGSSMARGTDGATCLTCDLPDQAALHGLLRKLQDLGLPLLSITKIDDERNEG
jgi:hypothetical protein